MSPIGQIIDDSSLPKDLKANLKERVDELLRLDSLMPQLQKEIETNKQSLKEEIQFLRLNHGNQSARLIDNLRQIELMARYRFACAVVGTYAVASSMWAIAVAIRLDLSPLRIKKEAANAVALETLLALCSRIWRLSPSRHLRHMKGIANLSTEELLNSAKEILESKTIGHRRPGELNVDAQLIKLSNSSSLLASFYDFCSHAMQEFDRFQALEKDFQLAIRAMKEEGVNQKTAGALDVAARAYTSGSSGIFSLVANLKARIIAAHSDANEILNLPEISRFVYANNCVVAYELHRKIENSYLLYLALDPKSHTQPKPGRKIYSA